MDNIKVSVICLTYNHQKYIRQCLESLVNQETDFNYEIIVHDDASTDNTADIVREFEKQYPEKMITIYQTENQYSKNVKITRNYIFPIVRGKYIAYCEGDDFWTDNHKLQIQFDAMEKNNKLRFCVHRVLTCDESGTAANTFFPSSRYSDTSTVSKKCRSLSPLQGPERTGRLLIHRRYRLFAEMSMEREAFSGSVRAHR